jgi:Tfp pilus assembly protein PilN
MKEIDFLPDWYKESRRRQLSLRRQYIALGVVFVMMIAWNMIATHMISKAAVELTQTEAERAKAEDMSLEFAKIKEQITELEKKAEFIEQVDSNINVANILAEMSYLIDEKIVLSKVQFIAEKFIDKEKNKSKTSAVRVVGQNSRQNRGLPVGDVCFKIVVSGIASDASDVADLICSLEDSPYFMQVYPSYSRNIKVRTTASPDGWTGAGPTPSGSGSDTDVSEKTTAKAEINFQASEFEISCYLANCNEAIIDN